jgi:hypothetical protein
MPGYILSSSEIISFLRDCCIKQVALLRLSPALQVGKAPERARDLKRWVELVTDSMKKYLGSLREQKGRGHRQNYCCWFTALPVAVTARGVPAIWRTGSQQGLR